MASYSAMRSKRQKGTVSKYAPAYGQTPPIYPASMETVKGWSIPDAKYAEVYERKDYTISPMMGIGCTGAPQTWVPPTINNGWLVQPKIGYDVASTEGRCSWGLWNPFQGFVQGQGPTERIGRQITVTSFEFLLQMYYEGPSSTGACLMWKIMLDTQTNGVGPDFDTASGNCPWSHVSQAFNGTMAKVWDPINLANTERYKMLKEGTVTCQPGSADVALCRRCLTVKEKCDMNITMEFGSNTGTIADIRSNCIFWVFGLYNNVDASINWGIQTKGYTRVRFIDP